jgi:DivIVA domain-containing protein
MDGQQCLRSFMPLTPADVHNITFHKASLGKRGYDAEEVDALREAITQEMIRLLEENDVLQDRARLDEAVASRMSQSGNVEAELFAVSDELDRARAARDEAEQKANSLQSRLEAARREVAARREAAGRAPVAPAAGGENGRVLAVAQRTAEQHLVSASQESEDVLGGAREQSEQMIEQARQAARDIEETSRLRDRDAAADLQDRQSALAQEVAELTEFAENYRAALQDNVRQHGEF